VHYYAWVVAAATFVVLLSSGWLTDRFDPRCLLFWYYGLRGMALLGPNAALSHAGLGLVAFIVFYGMDWVAAVPPTVALVREVFGRERVGVVFAWFSLSVGRRGSLLRPTPSHA
jgi:hypothetical protein